MAGEQLNLSVVHFDRHRYGDLLLRLTQDSVDSRLEIEELGGALVSREHPRKRIRLIVADLGFRDGVWSFQQVRGHRRSSVMGCGEPGRAHSAMRCCAGAQW